MELLFSKLMINLRQNIWQFWDKFLNINILTVYHNPQISNQIVLET